MENMYSVTLGYVYRQIIIVIVVGSITSMYNV